VRTVHDLVHDYQHVIAEVRMITGSKGIFDVAVDGDMLFSKSGEGRHAEPGEVLERFRTRYAKDIPVYERG
jgi:predicted Rdx family selenoprotein